MVGSQRRATVRYRRLGAEMIGGDLVQRVLRPDPSLLMLTAE